MPATTPPRPLRTTRLKHGTRLLVLTVCSRLGVDPVVSQEPRRAGASRR